MGTDNQSIFAVVPRGSYTLDDPDDWMVSCSRPSVMHLARDGATGTCWQWCQLLSAYTNGTSDSSQLTHELLRYITSTARATNSCSPPSAVLGSAAARDGVVVDGMVGLSVLLAFVAWRLLV